MLTLISHNDKCAVLKAGIKYTPSLQNTSVSVVRYRFRGFDNT